MRLARDFHVPEAIAFTITLRLQGDKHSRLANPLGGVAHVTAHHSLRLGPSAVIAADWPEIDGAPSIPQ